MEHSAPRLTLRRNWLSGSSAMPPDSSGSSSSKMGSITLRTTLRPWLRSGSTPLHQRKWYIILAKIMVSQTVFKNKLFIEECSVQVIMFSKQTITRVQKVKNQAPNIGMTEFKNCLFTTYTHKYDVVWAVTLVFFFFLYYFYNSSILETRVKSVSPACLLACSNIQFVFTCGPVWGLVIL